MCFHTRNYHKRMPCTPISTKAWKLTQHKHCTTPHNTTTPCTSAYRAPVRMRQVIHVHKTNVGQVPQPRPSSTQTGGPLPPAFSLNSDSGHKSGILCPLLFRIHWSRPNCDSQLNQAHYYQPPQQHHRVQIVCSMCALCHSFIFFGFCLRPQDPKSASQNTDRQTHTKEWRQNKNTIPQKN